MKRPLIQLTAFLLQNPFLNRFFTGEIYGGALKGLCAPGLNCYSCPAAAASCPLGSLQFFLSGAVPRLSLFVTGFLLAAGALFGRLICGFACPFGFLQDLLHGIKTPKFKARFKYARYAKYAVLGVFVVALPLFARDEWGLGAPWFCEYICPSGTVFGALPMLAVNNLLQAGSFFAAKAGIAAAAVLSAVFVNRPFCRALCPLGAVYALFNRFSLFRMRMDAAKCVSCGACSSACKLGLSPAANPNAPECVRCGDCVRACPAKALSFGADFPGRSPSEKKFI